MLSCLKNAKGIEHSLWSISQSFKAQKGTVGQWHHTSSLIYTSQNTLEDEWDEPLLRESNLIF